MKSFSENSLLLHGFLHYLFGERMDVTNNIICSWRGKAISVLGKNAHTSPVTEIAYFPLLPHNMVLFLFIYLNLGETRSLLVSRQNVCIIIISFEPVHDFYQKGFWKMFENSMFNTYNNIIVIFFGLQHISNTCSLNGFLDVGKISTILLW